jgi:hypothetical protein
MNHGILFHGIIVASTEAQLKEALHLHFGRKRKLYAKGQDIPN